MIFIFDDAIDYGAQEETGASARPCTSRAPSPMATDTAGNAEAHEDVRDAGDAVDARGIVTTSPAAEAGT